jgi:hypothetical protein
MKVLVELEVESWSRFMTALSAGSAAKMTMINVLDHAKKPEEFLPFMSRVQARHGLVTCPRPMVRRVSKKKNDESLMY